MPPKDLGLQMNFDDRAIVKDRRDGSNEELNEPIRVDVLLSNDPPLSEVVGVSHIAWETNPRLTVDKALEILRTQRITPLPSASTIKREFAMVKERRKYARK